MIAKVETAGECKILHVSGRIDFESALDFEQHINSMIQEGGDCFIIELSEVELLSSAGLRVLLSTAKRVSHRDASLGLASPSQVARQVFEISHFNLLFKIFSSVPEAITALRGPGETGRASEPGAPVSTGPAQGVEDKLATPVVSNAGPAVGPVPQRAEASSPAPRSRQPSPAPAPQPPPLPQPPQPSAAAQLPQPPPVAQAPPVPPTSQPTRVGPPSEPSSATQVPQPPQVAPRPPHPPSGAPAPQPPPLPRPPPQASRASPVSRPPELPPVARPPGPPPRRDATYPALLEVRAEGSSYPCKDGDFIGTAGQLAKAYFSQFSGLAPRHLLIGQLDGRWFVFTPKNVQHPFVLDGVPLLAGERRFLQYVEHQIEFSGHVFGLRLVPEQRKEGFLSRMFGRKKGN